MPRIDFNCDLGEGCGDDAAIVPWITSASIACGAHAGDDDTMRATLRLCRAHGVAAAEVPTVRVTGVRLCHVKPHGALYNLAARDREVANVVAQSVHAFDATLRLVGLAGSESLRAGEAAGLRVASEAFAERAYDADGRLAPRGTPGAVLEGIDEALAQVRRLVRDGIVLARDGTRVPLHADTLCLHGDRPDAAAFARQLRIILESEGITVEALR